MTQWVFGAVGFWRFTPEGLLLGASQMREPFYILLFTIILWSAGHWWDRKKLSISLPAAAISGLVLFSLSYRVAIPVIGAVLLWVWLEESQRIEKAWIKITGWTIIAVTAGVGLYLFREWLIAAFNWDSYLTVHGSGMVQYLLEKMPTWAQLPFIVAYGMLQPVLPAGLVAPAPWIWKSLAIFRAVGWYALIPCWFTDCSGFGRRNPSESACWSFLCWFQVSGY